MTGKQEYPNEVEDHKGNEMWDGTHNIKHDDRAEAMTGPFKWDLVNASKGHGFLSPSAAPGKLTRSSLRTNSGQKLNTAEKAAFLANCGQGVGANWAETATEHGR